MGVGVAKEGFVSAVERVLVPNHGLLGGRGEGVHWMLTTSMKTDFPSTVFIIHTKTAMASAAELLSIGMTLPRVLNPIAFFLQPSRGSPF